MPREIRALYSSPDSFITKSGKTLGEGQFGKVHLVRTKIAPRYIVALKSIEIAQLSTGKLRNQLRREIEIQSNMRLAGRSALSSLLTIN